MVTASGLSGGVKATGVTIAILHRGFTAAGEEHYFWAERDFVTWNDAYATTCGGPPLCGNPDDCIDLPNPCSLAPTPVRAKTWGSLKASYR